MYVILNKKEDALFLSNEDRRQVLGILENKVREYPVYLKFRKGGVTWRQGQHDDIKNSISIKEYVRKKLNKGET